MFGRSGAVKLWEEKGVLMNQFMTEVFVEQPLASRVSANNLMICIAVCIYALFPPPPHTHKCYNKRKQIHIPMREKHT